MTTKLSFGCQLVLPEFIDPPNYTPNLDGWTEPEPPDPDNPFFDAKKINDVFTPPGGSGGGLEPSPGDTGPGDGTCTVTGTSPIWILEDVASPFTGPGLGGGCSQIGWSTSFNVQTLFNNVTCQCNSTKKCTSYNPGDIFPCPLGTQTYNSEAACYEDHPDRDPLGGYGETVCVSSNGQQTINLVACYACISATGIANTLMPESGPCPKHIYENYSNSNIEGCTCTYPAVAPGPIAGQFIPQRRFCSVSYKLPGPGTGGFYCNNTAVGAFQCFGQSTNIAVACPSWLQDGVVGQGPFCLTVFQTVPPCPPTQGLQQNAPGNSNIPTPGQFSQSLITPPNLDLDLTLIARTPETIYRVRPNQVYLNIFKNYVHKSVGYYLERNGRTLDWKSEPYYDLNLQVIENSLSDNLLKIITNIRDVTGDLVPKKYFLGLIRQKLVENKLDEIDTYSWEILSKQEKTKIFTPEKTNNSTVNINLAFSYLEKTMVALDPENTSNQFLGKDSLLVKTLATDTEKALPIIIDGVETKYYINDDDVVIARAGLKIEDGDYINLTTSSGTRRLYLTSEKDHAYTISTFEKYVAISLLGGEPKINLTASSNYSSLVEFTYDLSTTRQDMYFLKLKTDSINTKQKSPYLDTTVAEYELMPTETRADFSAINEYIKFKSTHKIFPIMYDDLILDHMLTSSSISLTQDDIRFDGHSRKNNKTVPILVRTLPWYIIIIPTDRQEYNPLLATSVLNIGRSRIVSRSLKFKIPTNKKVFNPDLPNQYYPIVRRTSTYPEEDIYGSESLDGRKATISQTDNIFSNTYKTQEKPTRTKKTGLRVAYEIIKELNDNYVLDKGITYFDFYSRMNMNQFSEFKNNVRSGLLTEISSGLFGPKIYNPVKRAGDSASRRTALIKRRASAPAEDNYTQIKGTNTGIYFDPPTQETPSVVPVSRLLPFE